MRSHSLVIFASSTLLLAACSSGSSSGGPAKPVSELAKGTQFNQAVLDDVKALRLQSEPVLPDTSLLTEKDQSKSAKSQAKLNADGLAWLQKMKDGCQVSTSGQAPQSNGTGTTVVTIAGTNCPISSTTSTTQTNNMGQSGGSMDISASMDEKVLDPALVQASGSQSVNGQFQMHADFGNQSMHMTESGAFDMASTTTKFHLVMKMESTSSSGAGTSAIAFTISSDKGAVDLGMVADGQAQHYYIGGNEVSEQDFKAILGDFGSDMSNQH